MAAVDRAEASLRDLILGGDLQSGDRLGEVELAETLGMSRTPVREALRRLESQGLVEVTAHKGARVAAWSEQELNQVFVLRGELEGLAAAAAARQATDADIENLEAVARELKGYAFPASTRSLDKVTELNGIFHQSLLRISGSSTLTTVVSGLIDSTVLHRTQQAQDEQALLRSVNHHLEIVAAVRAGDPEWAQSVMRSHLLSARASLLGPRHTRPTPDSTPQEAP